MTSRAYRQRVAASKARLDSDLRQLARDNPGATVGEFQALARQRCSAAVTAEYAAELLGSTA